MRTTVHPTNPSRRRATVHDLRRGNRAAVLNQLMRTGEGTRAQLAATCSLSTATLTNVVTDLIAQGLVTEAGQLPSAGGRPIARLTPNAAGAYALGADVGEHGITLDLFDLHLTLVDRVHTAVRPSEFEPNNIRAVLRDAVETIRDRNASAVPRLIGLGLGMPGVVEPTTSGDFTVATQSLGWPTLSIGDLLPNVGLPAVAENGAKAMATAESWCGAATNTQHCVAALVGRGVGAGIVEGGELMRGITGSAGEWGHSKIAIGGRPCHCGGRGCLEAYIGGTSIVQRWAERGGDPTGNDEQDLRRLLELASDGDHDAAQLIDETIEILGIGLANLVNLVNPEVIVLGGWVGADLAASRLTDIRSSMAAHSLELPASAVRLERSSLGPDSVALGAALLVFQLLIRGDLSVPLAG